MAPRYDPERWRDTARYQMHLDLARKVAEAETRAEREAFRARLHADLLSRRPPRPQAQANSTSAVVRQTPAMVPQPGELHCSYCARQIKPATDLTPALSGRSHMSSNVHERL
eukprot:5530031-Pleurochrysis_carterae.AAC.1